MTGKELLARISIDSDVCFGKPCIRGHRIWVSLVLDLLSSGWTVQQLLDTYPGIEEADVRACIAYGAEMPNPESHDSANVAATAFKTFVHTHREEQAWLDDWEAVDLASPPTENTVNTMYPILEVRPDWRLESEPMGSKRKFWFRPDDSARRDWLFKYPRRNTGEHWAEKTAAEVASTLRIPHANVELAAFRGDRGSATESFSSGGPELQHGNALLEASVYNYNPETSFRHSSHTLANIWEAMDQEFVDAEASMRAKCAIAEYVVLDAVVGNTDRHHENWGVLRRPAGVDSERIVAPAFDHASSLGRELPDIRRELLLAENRLAAYAERARGAIYWTEDGERISPLELVRRAVDRHPDLFGPALAKLDHLDDESIVASVSRVPDDWMSPSAREFGIALMRYNRAQLEELV